MATKTTETRHEIMDVVASGNATTGGIFEKFGIEGLKNIARHMRNGHYQVAGLYVPEGKNDPAVDRKWAEELKAMPPSTRIVQITPPRRGT